MAAVVAVAVVTLRHLQLLCLVVAEAAAHRVPIACIRHPILAPLNLTAWHLLERLERLAQALAAATVAKAETARLVEM